MREYRVIRRGIAMSLFIAKSMPIIRRCGYFIREFGSTRECKLFPWFFKYSDLTSYSSARYNFNFVDDSIRSISIHFDTKCPERCSISEHLSGHLRASEQPFLSWLVLHRGMGDIHFGQEIESEKES